MTQQLDHYSSPFQQKKFPIVLVTANVSSPANLGSLLRIADAFSIEKIIFCGVDEAVLKSNRLKRTSRSAEKFIPFQFEEDLLQTVEKLAEDKHQVLALEITEDSIPIENFEVLQTNKKLVLIVGDENLGIPEEVITKTENNLHIPMFGQNSSMNVAQATGIALYEITKKINNLKD